MDWRRRLAVLDSRRARRACFRAWNLFVCVAVTLADGGTVTGRRLNPSPPAASPESSARAGGNGVIGVPPVPGVAVDPHP
jgi:hypothetical protein